MEKTIYDLKLHESILVEFKYYGNNQYKASDYISVSRVPGGWIYHFKTPIFVPYHNEFQIRPDING